MRLNELKEASYHGKDEKLEQLLTAVANVFPFIGYESMGAERREEDLDKAFQELTGMSWVDWKNRK